MSSRQLTVSLMTQSVSWTCLYRAGFRAGVLHVKDYSSLCSLSRKKNKTRTGVCQLVMDSSFLDCRTTNLCYHSNKILPPGSLSYWLSHRIFKSQLKVCRSQGFCFNQSRSRHFASIKTVMGICCYLRWQPFQQISRLIKYKHGGPCSSGHSRFRQCATSCCCPVPAVSSWPASLLHVGPQVS